MWSLYIGPMVIVLAREWVFCELMETYVLTAAAATARDAIEEILLQAKTGVVPKFWAGAADSAA